MGMYKGYKRIWNNEKRVWEYEHRLFMEKNINRKLTFNEHVHHINGIKTDNTIDNLLLVTAKEHERIHRNGIKNRKHYKCSVPFCNRPHHAKWMCNTHYMWSLRRRGQVDVSMPSAA